MKQYSLVIALLGCAIAGDTGMPQQLQAEDSVVSPARSAIDRSLSFLQRDAVKWRQEKNCSTCHHGTMTLWVQLEAKSRGFAVKPEELEENTRWVKERIMERVDLPRDARPGWSMVNTPSIYLAIMANVVPDQNAISAEDLERISGHFLRHQEENGAWIWSSAPPKNTPPPFFESDEVATRLTVLALTPRAASSSADALAIRASLSKAEKWLREEPPTDTTQASVMRLAMALQTTAASEEVNRQVEGLRKSQNADGGWSQIRERSSDAYATGQVLYVLSLAGVLQEDETIRKAIDYLIATQQNDGSWPMTKRTHPGETPTENMIPISYFGSAWATLGLLRYETVQSLDVP